MAKKVEKKEVKPKRVAKGKESKGKRTAKGKAALLLALRENLGIVTPSCEQVKINRSTFYVWYSDDPDFKKQVDDINQIALDFVESQHYRLIESGNPASIIFHLKTKGKTRGYIEKTEIEHSGSVDLDVTHATDLQLSEIIANKE